MNISSLINFRKVQNRVAHDGSAGLEAVIEVWIFEMIARGLKDTRLTTPRSNYDTNPTSLI